MTIDKALFFITAEVVSVAFCLYHHLLFHFHHCPRQPSPCRTGNVAYDFRLLQNTPKIPVCFVYMHYETKEFMKIPFFSIVFVTRT
jgi:hypothetical protein